MAVLSTDERATIRPTSAPTTPRLELAADRDAQTVLDGGWWPRTGNSVAELPGLLLALSARYGRIRHLMLNGSAWDRHFRKLAVGDDVVRIGWFSTLDTALAVATNERGDQIDLVLVPPSTSDGVAGRAMRVAADPGNTRRAAAVLADATNAPEAGATAAASPRKAAPARTRTAPKVRTADPAKAAPAKPAPAKPQTAKPQTAKAAPVVAGGATPA